MLSRVPGHPALNVFRNEQSVEAGGNRIRLAVDFLALDAIEGATGRKTPEIVRSMMSGPCQLSVIATVTWGLLLRHYPEITVEEAASLMFCDHRDAISEAVSGLFEAAFNLESPAEKSGSAKAEWSIKAFLIEWIKLGGSPTEFWRQTPKSYVVIMEALAHAAMRQLDLCIVNAWHTAVFALNGYGGKLKPLADFLSSKPEPEDDGRLQNAKIIHFFQSLKARGVPIDISRAN
jgi:hypothetical protein